MFELSDDDIFSLDFNFHQVPSALAVNIPVEAAALMLNITAAQFTAYTDYAFAQNVAVGQSLLEHSGTVEAIRKLIAPRDGHPSTIMTVGDSITTYRYGYAEILRALIGLVEPQQAVHFYNHGRSGYTSTHGLEHTFTQYLAQKPDWVFLKYGANDTKRFNGAQGKLLVSIEEYTANFTAMVDAFLNVGARIVLITPSPVVESIVNNDPNMAAMSITWDNTDIQACAHALKNIARERNLPLVDLVSVFTTNPDPALYCPDGLHPGPAGHKIMIEHVLDSINTYT